jgi:ubiquinol-cytochrome c reductase cytochrome b subunit
MEPWQEEYKRRYAELKEQGKSFFPYTVFKDVCVALLVLALLYALAYYRPAGLEPLADPTDTHYNPRPEWYFLFLFQALKFFPGHLEAVAAIILPGLAVLLLMAVPLLDRGPKRHPLDRPFWTLLGLASLAGFAALTWAGMDRPMTNPSEEADPQIASGRRLYDQMSCAYCHKIGGKGGAVGPALDKGAGNETEAWLTKHFADPQSVTPGSTMPKMNLLDDEVKVLVAYMKSLHAEEPFTKAAPKLFADHCASCHKLGKVGEEGGPDLSFIGTARDKAFIKKYMEDPSVTKPDSAMPAFKGQLTDVELEDLARYLSAQGR